MKRVGHLWPRLISFHSLARAAERARRRKRSRADVLQFEFDLERNLWQLHEELATKTYRPGPYHTFRIFEPKQRLISHARQGSAAVWLDALFATFSFQKGVHR